MNRELGHFIVVLGMVVVFGLAYLTQRADPSLTSITALAVGHYLGMAKKKEDETQ